MTLELNPRGKSKLCLPGFRHPDCTARRATTTGDDMNVGSVNWLYTMMKPVTAADSSGETDQPLTFRDRPIVGYARDGLPIVSETPEERQQEIDRLLAAE